MAEKAPDADTIRRIVDDHYAEQDVVNALRDKLTKAAPAIAKDLHQLLAGFRHPTLTELRIGYPFCGNDISSEGNWLNNFISDNKIWITESIRRALLEARTLLHSRRINTKTLIRIADDIRAELTQPHTLKQAAAQRDLIARILAWAANGDSNECQYVYLPWLTQHIFFNDLNERLLPMLATMLRCARGDVVKPNLYNDDDSIANSIKNIVMTWFSALEGGAFISRQIAGNARNIARIVELKKNSDLFDTYLDDRLGSISNVEKVLSEIDQEGQPKVTVEGELDYNDDEFKHLEEAQNDVDKLIESIDPRKMNDVPKKPAIIVLQTLDHLPKGKDAHSPFHEFKDFQQKPLPLNPTADVIEHAIALKASYPWACDVIDKLLNDIAPRATVRLRPTLLVGKPGCGKTSLAKEIGDLFGVKPTIFNCAGGMDGSFGGTSRQWSTGRACVPLQAIRRTGIANPLIIIDEIEKASSDRRNGTLTDSLIPFLADSTASEYHDPYVECAVNLSQVSYIATANSLDGIEAPVRDRFRIISVPMPAIDDIDVIAKSMIDDVRKDRGLDIRWMPDLAPDEIELIKKAWRRSREDLRSLRLIRRIIETICNGRDDRRVSQ